MTFTVPEPVKVPAPEITSAAAGVNTAEELTVIVPATAKFPAEVTVAPEAIVKLKKVGAPAIEREEPLFMVMVPAVGAKAALVVSTPVTVAVVEAVIVAEIFRPL